MRPGNNSKCMFLLKPLEQELGIRTLFNCTMNITHDFSPLFSLLETKN